MATDASREQFSDLPYHPGEFAAEEAAARGLTPDELAAAMGRPLDEVLDLLECKIPVSPALAVALEAAMDVSADSWLKLQKNYHDTVEFNRRRATA